MLKSTKKISLLKCLSLQNLLSVLKSQSLKFSKICKSKTSKHSKMSKSTKSSLSLLKCLNVTITCRQFLLTFYGQTFILIKFQKNPPIDFGKEHVYRFLPYMGMAAILVM